MQNVNCQTATTIGASNDPEPRAPSPQPPRPGMTLIELLVVIVIMTTLVAAAIPLLTPANDDRRERRGQPRREYVYHRRSGAGGVNESAVRRGSQAVVAGHEKGRGSQRLRGNVLRRAAAAVLGVRRQLAGLRGDASDAARLRARAFVTRGTATQPNQDDLPTGWDPDLFPSGTIRPGDVVQINGTQFVLRSDQLPNITLDSNGYFAPTSNGKSPQILACPLNDSGQQINPKYDDIRVTKSAVSPRHNRRIGLARRRTRFCVSRRRLPISRTSCQKGRRSTCGRRAWEAAITFIGRACTMIRRTVEAAS